LVDECKPTIFEKEPTDEHDAIADVRDKLEKREFILDAEANTVAAGGNKDMGGASDVRDSLEKREFILDAEANTVAAGGNKDMGGAFLVHDSSLIEKNQIKKCSIASNASSTRVMSD